VNPDAGLRAPPPSGRVRLGVVSDVHWHADGWPRASWHNPFDFAGVAARLDRALELFADADVDAVVVLGDLTHAGDEGSMRLVLDRLASFARHGLVLAVPGNHDCVERDDQLERCCIDGVGVPGGAGTEVGGLRVFGMAIETDVRSGAFRSKRDAALGRVDVLLSHFPVLSRASRLAGRGLAYAGDLLDQEQLAEQVGRRDRPLLVLSGHLHARESHAFGPVLQLTAGALVEPPFEVAVVEVERGPSDVLVRRRAVRLGPSAGVRDPVFAPAQESWSYDGRWRCTP
jgi:predicted phosphodiesterase